MHINIIHIIHIIPMHNLKDLDFLSLSYRSLDFGGLGSGRVAGGAAPCRALRPQSKKGFASPLLPSVGDGSLTRCGPWCGHLGRRWAVSLLGGSLQRLMRWRLTLAPPRLQGMLLWAGPRCPGASSGSSGPRLFCPVAGCPRADTARARGWTSAGTLRMHVDAHLAGSLTGRGPADWLHARNLQRCLACGLTVATRFGVHPTCRPTARAAAGSATTSPRPSGPSNDPLLTSAEHVPAGARHAWSQALTQACAAVAEYNDERAWVQLLMLPKAVLCAPPANGPPFGPASASSTAASPEAHGGAAAGVCH